MDVFPPEAIAADEGDIEFVESILSRSERGGVCTWYAGCGCPEAFFIMGGGDVLIGGANASPDSDA